jgi:hypothetical protein
MMYSTYDKTLAERDGYAYRPIGGNAEGVASGVTTLTWQADMKAAITGGTVCAWQATYGDTVSIEVGYDDGAGTWTTKRVLTRDLPILLGGRIEIGADYALEVPPELSLRVTYTSTGTNTPQIGVNINSWFPAQEVSQVNITFTSNP